MPQDPMGPHPDDGGANAAASAPSPLRMNRAAVALSAVTLTSLACAWAAICFRSQSDEPKSIAEAPRSNSNIEKSSMPSAVGKWGTLKGQILLAGEIPKIPPVVCAGDSKVKDASFSAAQDIPSEALLVDPGTKGIANVVIFMLKKPSAVHPNGVRSTQEEVVFNLKNCRFAPHVALVRTDQAIRVVSSDPVIHSIHSQSKKNMEVNVVLDGPGDAGMRLPIQSHSEKLPVKVISDIHDWMSAYWVILDHPYAAITDSTGNYEIGNLPVGKHHLVIWHESAGVLDQQFTVSIDEGVNLQQPREFTAAEILK